MLVEIIVAQFGN